MRDDQPRDGVGVQNLGVRVDEFYGHKSDSPEVLNAARTANVILYEGHLSSQDLIDNPELRRTSPPEYADDEEDDIKVDGPADNEEARRAPVARVVPAEPIPRRLQGPLTGLPIVFLQSCESADDGTLWRLDELGGAALIGSMTSIHSGAGSAMLNAAMTSALYRGGTLGEVLRDAQNYMLCVEELKGRRGHKEQAKGVRVAFSFRLWGDPELRLLPMPLSRPRLAAVRAQWVGTDGLRIDVPAQRLPEAESDKYTAFPFPDSQFAGLLRTESDATKRLLPVYFFCLPLPPALEASEGLALEPSRATPGGRMSASIATAAWRTWSICRRTVKTPASQSFCGYETPASSVVRAPRMPKRRRARLHRGRRRRPGTWGGRCRDGQIGLGLVRRAPDGTGHREHRRAAEPRPGGQRQRLHAARMRPTSTSASRTAAWR